MALTREKLAETMKVLERNGLTPLDLVEWTHLLQLQVALRSGSFLDLDVRHSAIQAVEAALMRKAALTDSENGNTTATSVLNSLGIS